ncbi:MAG: hypothetical protein U0599_03885 [Vicinamibacteria bacterium]
MWRKKTVFAQARIASSTIDACEYWSRKTVSPERIRAEMNPTFAL